MRLGLSDYSRLPAPAQPVIQGWSAAAEVVRAPSQVRVARSFLCANAMRLLEGVLHACYIDIATLSH